MTRARVADTPDPPRADLETAKRPIQDLLAEWRAAERRLLDARPNSAAATEARMTMELARDAYREAFELAVRDLPEA